MKTAFSGHVPSTDSTGLAALCFNAELVPFEGSDEDEVNEEAFSVSAGVTLKKFSSV